jgi:hypothetical protein
VRQAAQAIFEHLNGPKELIDSIAYSKNELSLRESSHADHTTERKDKGKEAMKTISQAEEAIVLIESAEVALQSATDKVNSLQSFIQLKSKIQALGL